jgi:two-component system, cell cycle sensor histidine kinase and response regulator CckA
VPPRILVGNEARELRRFEAVVSVETSTQRRYAVALLLFAFSFLGRRALAPVLGDSVPYITFSPAIAASAWYGGLGPGLITTFLGGITSVYLFFQPGAITTADVVGLALFLAIGTLITSLTQAVKRSERQAHDELLARRQFETELRKREDELKRSEQRFRALIENSSDAIALLDEAATILYASASTTRVLGYTPEEFVGQNSLDLVHPDERKRAEGMLTSLRHTKRRAATNQLRFRHADGSWCWIESVITNALEDPHIHALVVNYRDIGEHKNLEEQLLQSQKLEAIGRLAGGIAHDFNNLLTIINSYSELALNTLGKQSPVYDDIEEINKAGMRAASLSSQLLAFSRRQVLEPTVLNLNSIVSDMHRMLRRLIGEDIDVVAVLDPALESVRADRGKIEQMIMNLVVNSSHAISGGGRVTIETANVDLDDAYARRHQGVVPGSYVMLAVSDTGAGMDEQTIARIFEPFFTTKEHGKGTGLGLSIVYGFVKQSRGNIWVYSEPGKGSTFKIYLPQVKGHADNISRPRAVKPILGSETIVVVEDDESVRKLIRSILTNVGYTVIEARDGQEALALCQNQSHGIHLVLSDLIMPNLSGPEFAARITSLRPELKVLFMSGYTDNAVVLHGVLEADTPYLQKPFTPAGLTSKVREVLEGTR